MKFILLPHLSDERHTAADGVWLGADSRLGSLATATVGG